MTLMRTTTALTLALALAACAPKPVVVPADPALAAAGNVVVLTVAPRYTVTEVRVSVPRTLRVSEANSFHPRADNVWRGEPAGDRYAQVAAIFNAAAASATANMVAGPEVIVELTVTRFHALTEKTRYTVGGVHSVRFDLTLRDAATGRVIDGPRPVDADVKASGGAQAIAEDQAGRTQRVVIEERLIQVITRELTAPPPG